MIAFIELPAGKSVMEALKGTQVNREEHQEVKEVLEGCARCNFRVELKSGKEIRSNTLQNLSGNIVAPLYERGNLKPLLIRLPLKDIQRISILYYDLFSNSVREIETIYESK